LGLENVAWREILNIKILVVAEIVSICLLVWFGYGLLRTSELVEEPVVSNTINFANDVSSTNSLMTVDIAQNDKFVKLQVTQGYPNVTLCPIGDPNPMDCAPTDTNILDLKGINIRGSTVWMVQPGSYSLGISDSQNEIVSYNLFVIHQPGSNTVLRLVLSTLIFGCASIGFGWAILNERKKRSLKKT
jgi:hypothetical protein